jgi:hypothetical protein
METEYVKPDRVEAEAQMVSIGTRVDPNECVRCGGLMVADRYIDLLDDTGQLEFTANRCVQCGEVVDATILRNRMANKARVQHVHLAHVA